MKNGETIIPVNAEQWCTAPPRGRIAGWGSSSEEDFFSIYVEGHGEPRPKRTQPTRVHQCPANVVWDAGGVRLEADGFEIRANGHSFSPLRGTEVTGWTSEDAGLLEGRWIWQGRRMSLGFELGADGSHWWIERVRTLDGVVPAGEHVIFAGLRDQTRTPIGEAFEGDLSRQSFGPRIASLAWLSIEDMRLSAFPAPDLRSSPDVEAG